MRPTTPLRCSGLRHACLLCPRLTSAPRSERLSTRSVPIVETRHRPPAISSTAFHAQPPNLRLASLMDMGFAVCCQLARRGRLVFDSCPSARVFAPRFLRTPPRGDALAACYPSPPSGWERTFTSKLSNMRGVQQRDDSLTAPVPFSVSTGAVTPSRSSPSRRAVAAWTAGSTAGCRATARTH